MSRGWRLVVDALQVAPEFSGAGRITQQFGDALRAAALPVPVVLRCAADAVDALAPHFPPGTHVHTPIASSRPRWRRLAQQQLIGPLRDDGRTILLYPADQGPVWGRAPVLIATHDVRRLTHPHTSASTSERLLYRVLQPLATRHALHVFTTSRFSAGEIVRTIRGAPQPEVVATHPRPVADAPSNATTGPVLAICALRPYKGLGDLLDAYSQSGSGLPPLDLVGASEDGGTWVADRVRDEALSDRVRLRGWVPDDELDELYRRALVAVHPSHHEGYGLPVAESLARGVPTVASDIPPHREIAGDAALYFAPGDARAIAAALERVSRDAQLRTDLAHRALERSQALADMRPTWSDALAQAVARVATTR